MCTVLTSVPVFGIKPSIISVTAAQEVPMPRLFDVPGRRPTIIGFDRNEEVFCMPTKYHRFSNFLAFERAPRQYETGPGCLGEVSL